MSTAAGREGMAVWRRAIESMTGPQKVAKAFELTEATRQTMRAGIRHQFPNASDAEIQKIHVERLLQFSGISLAEVRQKMKQQASALANKG